MDLNQFKASKLVLMEDSLEHPLRESRQMAKANNTLKRISINLAMLFFWTYNYVNIIYLF